MENLTIGLFEAILNRNPDSIVLTDPQRRVLWMNQEAEKLLGSPSKEVTGRLWDTFVGLGYKEIYRTFFEGLIDEPPQNPSASTNFRFLGFDRDCTEFVGEMNLSILHHQDKPIVVHTIRKVTVQSEEAAPTFFNDPDPQPYLMEMVENFISSLSERVSEPVKDILSLSHDVSRRYRDIFDEEARGGLDSLQVSALKIKEMMAGLNQYSDVNRTIGQKQTVDLDALITDVLEEFQDIFKSGRVEIERGYFPKVQADLFQMQTLFKCLLLNAYQFRRPETPLKVFLDSYHGGNACWHILIKDNGMGFDNGQANKIFQPFVKLESGSELSGPGLGLAICQKIVQGHGGKVSALSDPGNGSTFIITLPEQME